MDLNPPCAFCVHTYRDHVLPGSLGGTQCKWLGCRCLKFISKPATEPDMINHPPHYTNNPSGVECIDITMHMNFCIGNAVKYLWRVDDKGDSLENLKKAKWYIECEIKRREDKK